MRNTGFQGISHYPFKCSNNDFIFYHKYKSCLTYVGNFTLAQLTVQQSVGWLVCYPTIHLALFFSRFRQANKVRCQILFASWFIARFWDLVRHVALDGDLSFWIWTRVDTDMGATAHWRSTKSGVSGLGTWFQWKHQRKTRKPKNIFGPEYTWLELATWNFTLFTKSRFRVLQIWKIKF